MIKAHDWKAYEDMLDNLLKAFKQGDIAEQDRLIAMVALDSPRKPWSSQENDLLWGVIQAAQKLYNKQIRVDLFAPEPTENLNRPTFTAKKQKIKGS